MINLMVNRSIGVPESWNDIVVVGFAQILVRRGRRNNVCSIFEPTGYVVR
jgi:hypothetical protein